jgi:hypothetical protein
MKFHIRLLILGMVLALVVTGLTSGAPKSHAANTYYVYNINIRNMFCSDTGFDFVSDALYNAPSSGYTLNWTVATSAGFNYDSGQHVPGAVSPGSGTVTGVSWNYTGWWPAAATPYTIVHTVNFWVNGVLASQSIATFTCESVEGPLTLVSLDNQANPLAVPGCNIALPSTAVMGALVADAQAYWAPGKLTSPLYTLPAGKTAYVIGLDESGDYYKILWVCQYLWVQKDTMGPDFDDVWQGHALPTDIVE